MLQGVFTVNQNIQLLDEIAFEAVVEEKLSNFLQTIIDYTEGSALLKRNLQLYFM